MSRFYSGHGERQPNGVVTLNSGGVDTSGIIPKTELGYVNSNSPDRAAVESENYENSLYAANAAAAAAAAERYQHAATGQGN